MTVIKLMDSLHIIPGLVNTYLLETAGGLTLIDTGFPRDTAKIIRGIIASGRPPRDVRHILITHAHPDHIGGAAALREARLERRFMRIGLLHRSSRRADPFVL